MSSKSKKIRTRLLHDDCCKFDYLFPDIHRKQQAHTVQQYDNCNTTRRHQHFKSFHIFLKGSATFDWNEIRMCDQSNHKLMDVDGLLCWRKFLHDVVFHIVASDIVLLMVNVKKSPSVDFWRLETSRNISKIKNLEYAFDRLPKLNENMS